MAALQKQLQECKDKRRYGNFPGAKIREVEVVHGGDNNEIVVPKNGVGAFSMWRPGGKRLQEWWWYNGAATAAYDVEIDGRWREILQAN